MYNYSEGQVLGGCFLGFMVGAIAVWITFLSLMPHEVDAGHDRTYKCDAKKQIVKVDGNYYEGRRCTNVRKD